MSISRFNYTQRKKITREHVSVVIQGDLPEATIRANFSLSDYAFPGSAQLVLEAQAGWTVQRFEFGTIDSIRPPGDARLTEFDSPSGVIFRLKVIAAGHHGGILLGTADGLRPSSSIEEAGQRSFVVVRPAELGDLIWRLEFDEEQAILLVNRRLGDHHDFLRRKEVVALVFPEVLRQLLVEAVDRPVDEDDHADWAVQAKELGVRLATRPAPRPDDDEALEEWAVDAVKAFARQHRLLDNVSNWIEGDQ